MLGRNGGPARLIAANEPARRAADHGRLHAVEVGNPEIADIGVTRLDASPFPTPRLGAKRAGEAALAEHATRAEPGAIAPAPARGRVIVEHLAHDIDTPERAIIAAPLHLGS